MGGIKPTAVQFGIVVILFLANMANTSFSLGKQTEAIESKIALVRLEMQVMKVQVEKADTDRSVLVTLVRDIALLQARDTEFDRRISQLKK